MTMTTPDQFESFTRAVIEVLNDSNLVFIDKLPLIEDVATEHSFVTTDDDQRSNGGKEFFVP